MTKCQNLNGVCLLNLTAIANHGIPSGKGRKGGVAKRKGSRKIPTIETRSIRPCVQKSQPPTYYNTNTIFFMPKCCSISLCWCPFECILDQCFRQLWYEPPPFTSFEQPSLFSFICDCSSSCKYLPEYNPRFRQHCSSSCGFSQCTQSLRVAKFTHATFSVYYIEQPLCFKCQCFFSGSGCWWW